MMRRLGIVLAVAAAVAWGVVQAAAQTETYKSKRQEARERLQEMMKARQAPDQVLRAAPRQLSGEATPTGAQAQTYQSKRQEARERLQEMMKARHAQDSTFPAAPRQLSVPRQLSAKPKAAGGVALALVPGEVGFNPAVDYSLPNFAFSPNIRKFVDSLPGLGYDNRNNLGQYIPVAIPDTTTYPGSDYYEIVLTEYPQQMHSDLPPTLLRGYTQINTADPTVAGIIQYLGPLIIAQRDQPVRLLFSNELATGALGNLFLPVDPTIMGSGMGPDGINSYTQNRSTIHLHGGLVPWISDGTPHQWVTPWGEVTPYQKGDSFQNVPDMVGPGTSIPAPTPDDGMGTFYYPNAQSARLMFYHDHAYGITRLNVYGGVAAGYLLTDQVEEDLISGTNVSGVFGAGTPTPILPDLGGVYHYGIPLVIQDKTFVNDDTTPPGAGFPVTATPMPATLATDPLWATYVGTTGGNLWFPHEYMPNENIYDPSGALATGRWDYGPFMAPPMLVNTPTLPSPTIVPEAFQDTMVVNGCALPYVELPPTAIRFRLLNACNDRMLNLQLYYADPAALTEVQMVPAAPNDLYPTWPRDGRDGGVPDPTTAGPDIIQIGNECGFLPGVAVIPAQAVDFDYDRRSATLMNVSSKALYLGPAERADVIVDFSQCNDGDTLILYNDAPAPMPKFDTRYDFYTDDPDQTAIGGAPSTPAGFGPNTRTVMQIRIVGTPTAPYDLAALQDILPAAYRVAQDPPLVPQSAYNTVYGTAYPDIFANAVVESFNITGTPQPVARVVAIAPGVNYVTPPAVVFLGGGGTGAAATAALNGVTGITLVTGGIGYTTAPTVSITGVGTGAVAVATVSGGVVTTISMVDMGSGYVTAPTVALTNGGGAGAVGVATVQLGSVGHVTLTNPGSGYLQAPVVFLVGGGGTGAAADAVLVGGMPLQGKNVLEGFDMEFGRMFAILGSLPNPLIPATGATPVPGGAFYIDPPTEIYNNGELVLWRFSHIGVDTHVLHFHLVNAQLINRVDWTNVVSAPDANELGFKESMRVNPFEDVILAFRPSATGMNLPFQVPDSVRLLNPTAPAGSTMGFTPIAPVPGQLLSAQTTNVMTNFGWEYVWHCHLLGHEENDMMRPFVMSVGPPAAPTGLAAANGTVAPLSVELSWTDNSNDERGFTFQRARNSAFTTGLVTWDCPENATTYVDADPALLTRTTYYYRVRAWNVSAGGNSAWSNTRNFRTANGPVPLAPSNLATGTITTNSVVLTWTDNATNETGFVIQRATNAAFTTSSVMTIVNTPNLATFTRTGLSSNRAYWFRVAARNANGNGPWSNVVSATTLP